MNRIIRWGLKRLFILFQCVLVASLAACGGGGGGGGGSNPTPTDIPFQTFPSDYFSSGYTKTFNLTGSDTVGEMFTGSMAITTLPGPNTFNNQPAILVQTAASLTNTTANISVTGTVNDYYSTDINSNSLMALGSTSSSASSPASIYTYTLTSLDVIPQTAMIGDSGVVGSYSGSDAAAGRMSTVTWQLTNANNGFANIVLTNNTYNGATLQASEKHTTMIDQLGNPQSIIIEIYYANNGITVTLHGN